MARDVRITYGLAGTQKFEIPADQISLSQVLFLNPWPPTLISEP